MWAEIEVTEGTLQQTALPHTLTTTELESTRREWTPCWKATSMVAEPSRGQMYISHHKGWVSFLVELAPGAQIHCSAKITGLSTNSTFKVSYEHYDLSHANSFCKVSAVYSISWSSLEYQIPRAHHPQAHQCYIRNLSLNYFVIRDAFKHSKTNSACNGTQPCKLSVGSMPSSYLLLATPKQSASQFLRYLQRALQLSDLSSKCLSTVFCTHLQSLNNIPGTGLCFPFTVYHRMSFSSLRENGL